MLTIAQLLEKLEQVSKDCKTYLEKAKTSEKQEDKDTNLAFYKAKCKEFEELQADLEQAKALDNQAKLIAKTREGQKPNDANLSLTPNAGDGKAKTQGTDGGATLEVVDDPKKDEEQKISFFLKYVSHGAKSLDGEQMKAIEAPSHRFGDFAETSVLIPKRIAKSITAQKGKVILSSDATGGTTDSGAASLVAPDFRPELLRVPIAMPMLYDYVRVVPAVLGKATWPKLDQEQGRFGGVAFTWKATEGEDKGETEPVFTDFEVSTNELSGWTETSLTALRRSATDLEGTITELFRDAARYEFSRTILRGSGSNRPLGVLNANNIKTVDRKQANKIAYEDLVKLEYELTQAVRVGGMYVVADGAEKYIKSNVDTTGRPIFTADVHSQVKNLLCGYSYVSHEFGPDLGEKGDVVFGNWNHYAFAIEDDIAIARSEHAEFKKGRVVFRMIAWVGGKPIYESSFAALDDVAS